MIELLYELLGRGLPFLHPAIRFFDGGKAAVDEPLPVPVGRSQADALVSANLKDAEVCHGQGMSGAVHKTAVANRPRIEDEHCMGRIIHLVEGMNG